MWEIIEPILLELTISFIMGGLPGIMAWMGEKRKTRDLTKVIDKSALHNKDFAKIALDEGLHAGLKVLKKLLIK